MGFSEEDAVPFDLSAGDSDVSVESAELDDEYDDLEDATDDDIDFAVEIHREDGNLTGSLLDTDLANDLDELITHLQRVPGDAGTVGFISIAGDFFVICRVRGRVVQILLSDASAANDWPLARDVLDYLGEDTPEDDEESAPVGDFDMFADVGMSGFDLERYASNYDDDTDEVVAAITRKIRIGAEFDRLIELYDAG